MMTSMNSLGKTFSGYETFISFKAAALYQTSLRSDDYTEIWQYNDFQNDGRPPSSIVELWILCKVTYVISVLCFNV